MSSTTTTVLHGEIGDKFKSYKVGVPVDEKAMQTARALYKIINEFLNKINLDSQSQNITLFGGAVLHLLSLSLFDSKLRDKIGILNDFDFAMQLSFYKFLEVAKFLDSVFSFSGKTECKLNNGIILHDFIIIRDEYMTLSKCGVLRFKCSIPFLEGKEFKIDLVFIENWNVFKYNTKSHDFAYTHIYVEFNKENPFGTLSCSKEALEDIINLIENQPISIQNEEDYLGCMQDKEHIYLNRILKAIDKGIKLSFVKNINKLKDDEDVICPVCSIRSDTISEIEGEIEKILSSNIILFQCSHKMCLKCFTSMKMRSRTRVTCPLCRANIKLISSEKISDAILWQKVETLFFDNVHSKLSRPVWKFCGIYPAISHSELSVPDKRPETTQTDATQSDMLRTFVLNEIQQMARSDRESREHSNGINPF